MNAAGIVAALRRAYPYPDYGFAVEVAQATGFQARRHLDVVIMDTWPSRGLELMGVEIKVSMSDLSRELLQPAKAEEIARFCNSFWLATPKGLVKDPSKLPFSWGLIEVDETGTVTKRIRAQRKQAEPITKEFTAALMRGARRQFDKNEAEEAMRVELERQRKRLEEGIEHKIAQRSSDNNCDAIAHRKLREALGDRYALISNDSIVKAMRIVMDAGFHCEWGGLKTVGHAIQEAAEKIDQALLAAGLQPLNPAKPKKGRASNGAGASPGAGRLGL